MKEKKLIDEVKKAHDTHDKMLKNISKEVHNYLTEIKRVEKGLEKLKNETN